MSVAAETTPLEAVLAEVARGVELQRTAPGEEPAKLRWMLDQLRGSNNARPWLVSIAALAVAAILRHDEARRAQLQGVRRAMTHAAATHPEDA